MATAKIVEAYIPAAVLLVARRTTVLKEKSIWAPIASEIDPPGKVEAAITTLKVKTRAKIAAEPYIEPPPPAHSAQEDSTDMNSFLLSAIAPDRSSTPASSAEQNEIAIVKSRPSVWSERQSKFGTRDGSDIMNK